ncbi:MAG: tetratricopeptide repeat protein [Acidobacteria bacterium]|nr:tetratricopeptide repeat protein [Acidobacteriota bacterium]
MRVLIPLLAASAAFVLLAAEPAPPLRGFSGDGARTQRALEQQARSIPDPMRMRSYMQRIAAEPHHAGSPASKAVAQYVLELFREWGLEANIEEFEALLPYPTKRVLELVAPVKYRARLQEPAVNADPDSSDKNQLPTYNAYSASGSVTAPLVYVNYGIPEDYEQLAKLGIDVKGKIVIARYGRSWRGTKPKVAQERGAAGCIIYSDPRDDGYFQGDTYPKGPFRPPRGVQRGSVMDMPVYVGDPLSPGWASEKGSKRLTVKEAETLMRIPVLPISYEDARPLLAALEGPVAPESWRGALPLTYHVGPGPATVRLEVNFDWTTKPLYNVIATIPGSVAGDEWVIYGNHHDAWVNGAHDPTSGAATLLETGRTLAEMRRNGWQPKRTIKLALWDGEEFGLVGSTEWAEKHAEDLSAKAVVYINSDTTGKGSVGAGGAPVLEKFIAEVLDDISDPVKKESLLKSARGRTGSNSTPGAGAREGGREFHLGPLGAGSDYVAFYHHLGVASLNLGFSGGDAGGVYHSIYDSFHWYTTFSDGDFIYSRTLAQVMATALMRLADASLLPFEYTAVAGAAQRYLDDLRKQKNAAKVDLSAVANEVSRLKAAGAHYAEQARRGAWAKAPAAALKRVNETLYRSERSLAPARGLSRRTWYRHVLAAPGLYTGYSAKTLPGIREALEAGKLDEARLEAVELASALRELRGRVEEASRLLGDVSR